MRPIAAAMTRSHDPGSAIQCRSRSTDLCFLLVQGPSEKVLSSPASAIGGRDQVQRPVVSLELCMAPYGLIDELLEVIDSSYCVIF